MSLLGDMTVKFSADLSGLTAGISSAKAQINSLESAAQGASTGMDDGVSGAAKRSGFNLLDFGAKVGQTIFGLKNLAQGAVALGGAMLEPNASMEQTRVGFETLLGAGQKTNAFLQQLQHFAAVTPFTFPELATDAQHMIAFGFAAKDVIPDLTDIGDAMSALGKGPAEIDAIVTVLGQMKAATKVNAGDMLQLTSAGIPAWNYLASAMHLSVAQVQKLSQEGKLMSSQAIPMLLSGMEKTFGGGMQKQATTFNGLLSTFQDNIGAAWRAFTGPLFDQAKAGLIQLGNLVSNPQFQKFAVTLGQTIGTGLSLLIQGIIKVVQIGAGLVDFFRNNQPAAIGLGAALTIVGTVMLGLALQAFVAFLASIPALVTGFLAWAGAASAAAIATLAAALPFILLAAAIVAAVALIVLAIQHWGQIVAWLKGAWASVSSFFAGIWQGIQHVFLGAGQWFHDRFTDAKNGVQSAFSGIGTWISDRFNDAKKGVSTAWTGINATVKTGSKNVSDTIGTAFQAAGYWFQWLYDHNYYIKAIVDFTVKVFNEDKKFIVAVWTEISAWLADKWNFIKTTATNVWNAVSTFFTNIFNKIKGTITSIWTFIANWISAQWKLISTEATVYWNLIYSVVQSAIFKAQNYIKSIWTAITGWLSTQWNTLVANATSLWLRISGVFASAYNTYLAGPLGGIGHAIGGFFGGLINSAVSWGRNIITGVANGISSAAGAVGNAIHSAISGALSTAGFHGIPGFATGIMNSPYGQLAMVGERGPELMYVPKGASIFPNGVYPQQTPSSPAVAAAQAGAAGVTHVHFYLDSREMADVVASRMDSRVRLQFGARSRG